jgi:hypothetical protein
VGVTRPGLAALLAAGLSLVAAPAAAASAARVVVSAGSSTLGAATSARIDLDAGDTPAAFAALYVPAGYGVVSGQPTGATIGSVASGEAELGGVVEQLTGSLVVRDPASAAADAAAVACGAPGAPAGWALELATSQGSIAVPVVARPATESFAAFRLDLCFGAAGLTLHSVKLTLPALVQNPTAAGVYAWRAVLVPPGSGGAGSAVEARSLLAVPVRVSLAGRYDARRQQAVLAGVVTAGGSPLAHATLPLFATSGGRGGVRSGSVTTDGAGRFSVRRAVHKRTSFRVSGSLRAQDVTATSCGDPIAPGGCVSATRSELAAESPSVRVTPPAIALGHAVLRYGSRGAQVRLLQEQLIRLHYLPPGAHGGVLDDRTWHAVVAFQGWRYLGRTGVVDARTWRALATAILPQPFWGMHRGVEIDISRQVLLLVDHGRTVRAIHVSTAAPGHYTPHGHFHVYRKERLSWSVPFKVWMPYANYFDAGFAVHGLASVPAYPASHGCVRVPLVEAPIVYAFTYVGMPVWVR